mmetsp:Transcript_13383/g.25291  ORF Transcript_13383/g.25291 Transcript_13383/m.25291 type:complete len:534 (+) Transcript_13383:78-1679(+)
MQRCNSAMVFPLRLAVVFVAFAHARLGTQPAAESSPSEGLGFRRGAQGERQEKIVDMMRHAWNGYASHCWGGDELYPLSQSCGKGWGLGLTMLDSLDTLYLMGLDEEFEAARNWVADKKALDFSRVRNINLFETSIRALGGLLGAHALSGDAVFRERAQELGDRLLPGLAGPNDVPYSDLDVHSGQGAFLGGDASTAEATTLGLEFRTLSQVTGNPSYGEAVDRVTDHVHGLEKLDGLVMNLINPQGGDFVGGLYSLGSRGDSYYEYLLKQWLLSDHKDLTSLQDYLTSMEGVQKHLVKNTTGPLQLTYIAELVNGGVNRKMDHLVCFLPGLLALGAHNGLNDEHQVLAERLMRTCHEMYIASGRNLGAEIAFFDTGGKELLIKPQDAHDILRPEFVESLFYMYRLTHDKKYQDWGWEIAQAIDEYAKVEGGYASLDSVFHLKKRDKMESFFLSETLKYLYLLMDDTGTQVPLDKFVFNTEGHPLRIHSSSSMVSMPSRRQKGGHGSGRLSLFTKSSKHMLRRHHVTPGISHE